METKKVIRELLATARVGHKATVYGWVRTKRVGKQVAFVALYDGSTLEHLQTVSIPANVPDGVTAGACVKVHGEWVASQGKGQKVELRTSSFEVLGPADPATYPLQPKRHTMAFLRRIPQFRLRTRTLQAVFRIRHVLTRAIHDFFHERGFLYLHTPLLTAMDAEGAGEMFRVTALDMKHVPKISEDAIDFSKDFFGKPAYLTVSGQLEGEIGAMALGRVYTFGPTFRAENSNTTRHLAEFWMVEPEIAFYDLEDIIGLGYDLLQSTLKTVLSACEAEIDWLQQRLIHAHKASQPKGYQAVPLRERFTKLCKEPLVRLTYTEAIEILKTSKANQKGRFAYPIQGWGDALQSEHERFLVEQYFGGRAVVVTGYPRDQKAFYMHQCEDGRTVAAMDLLIPGIGEVIGGSQREVRLPKLKEAMARMHIPGGALEGYLDLRRFGSAPHSGFGLGLERWLRYLTGMENIRDVIAFPRAPHQML